MKIIIIGIGDNRQFIDSKGAVAKEYRDKGNVHLSYKEFALCDRVWLGEEFILPVGWEYKYAFKSPNGLLLEGYILEKGIDEKGYFIQFLVDGANRYTYKNINRPHLTCGDVDVELILSPDMINGSYNLIQACQGKWPNFHEANLSILERANKFMILRLAGGFLFDKVVDLKIYEVAYEDYGSNSLEYFTQQWLTSLEFRRREGFIEVLLCNDYTIINESECIDASVIINSELDNEIEFIEEEHINHGVIKCKELVIEVSM